MQSCRLRRPIFDLLMQKRPDVYSSKQVSSNRIHVWCLSIGTMTRRTKYFMPLTKERCVRRRCFERSQQKDVRKSVQSLEAKWNVFVKATSM